MYRYKIKMAFQWLQAWLIPNREIMIRQSNTIKHISLSPLKQLFIFIFVLGFSIWTGIASYNYINYDLIIKTKEQELLSTQENHKKLIAEISAYQSQLDEIRHKINNNIVISKNEINIDIDEEESASPSKVIVADKKGAVINAFKSSLLSLINKENSNTSSNDTSINQDEKERLQGDIDWLERKLTSLSSGKTSSSKNADSGSIDVKLSKAELQRDLALSEASNLRNKVSEMEGLIGEMQKTQVVVFDKVANLADDGISAIERKLSGVKDALNNVGLGLEGLLAKVNIEYEKGAASGGPFIPVSISTPVTPNLKNEVLNVSLNNLVSGVARWNNLTKLEERLPIGKPLDRVRLTSRFGTRNDPFSGRKARHEGLDFGGIRGEPIYTTAPGKVVYAGLAGSFGYMVEIDHGLGIKTRYAHLGSIAVKRGQKVTIGQKIATMGNSGRSTGVHLHYEVRIKGTPLDPLNFVRIDRNVSKK